MSKTAHLYVEAKPVGLWRVHAARPAVAIAARMPLRDRWADAFVWLLSKWLQGVGVKTRTAGGRWTTQRGLISVTRGEA